MRYSNNFERDYNWYMKYKNVFTFSGSDSYKRNVIESKNGKSAKECFYKHDSTGKVIPTNEPELLLSIFACKAGINFQIKQWAEGRADGTLPGIEFSVSIRDGEKIKREEILTIEEEYELLPWMVDAVENQKVKYYK